MAELKIQNISPIQLTEELFWDYPEIIVVKEGGIDVSKNITVDGFYVSCSSYVKT